MDTNSPILDADLQEANLETAKFASFWTRAGASIIDGLIFIPLIALSVANILIWKMFAFDALLSVVYVIYKPYMEWKYSATIGKRSMKILVRDEFMQPISLSTSITRNIFYILNAIAAVIASYALFSAEGFDTIHDFMEFSKFRNANGLALSNLTNLLVVISILVVAFDKKKQALHDKIAKTYVVMK